jgi:hypothetical protein
LRTGRSPKDAIERSMAEDTARTCTPGGERRDRGAQRGLGRAHEGQVGGALSHVHGQGGVHHPAVHVDPDVQLGQVAVRVALSSSGDGQVVRGHVVARRLHREGQRPAPAVDLVLHRHADVADLRSRRDEPGPRIARRGGDAAGLLQLVEHVGRDGGGHAARHSTTTRSVAPRPKVSG